jgi:hypothetical protein
MQKILVLFSLAAIVLLSGCATSQTLSDADRSSIKSVTLNPKIESVPLYYDTIGTATALVVAHDNNAVSGAVETEFMANHGIKIEDIVRNEFVQQWNSRRVFPLVDKNGDAEITLKINYYILGIPNIFSPALRPGIGIEAIIKDKTGKEVWKKSSVTTPLNSSLPKHTWDEMEVNPALFKEAFELATRKVVKDLLDDLEKS